MSPVHSVSSRPYSRSTTLHDVFIPRAVVLVILRDIEREVREEGQGD